MYQENKGFTLIEILIVITILGILSLMVGFSYITLLTHINVDTSNQDIYSIVKKAQDNAMNNLDGYSQYGVEFQNNEVILFPGGSYSPSNSNNDIYYLLPEVTLYNLSPTDNNPIVFNSVNGQLTNTGVSFDIGNPTYFIQMNINNNGAVY